MEQTALHISRCVGSSFPPLWLNQACPCNGKAHLRTAGNRCQKSRPYRHHVHCE
ncbi:Uncharacterised protein [Vibrio cholerae]|nr:Uncharacterised protein [Vibrio cholerae]